MRLIDADAMRDDWLENGENEYVYDTNAVLESIDAQPTIEAEPVVHGRWKKTSAAYISPYDGETTFYEEVLSCSACGKVLYTVEAQNYCPNCGAKMDGRSEGE